MNAPVLHILSVIEALPWLACCSAGAVPGQGGGRTVTHCIFLALCYNSCNRRLLHLPLCNRCMATSPHPDPGQPRDQLTGRARAPLAARRSPNICLGEKRAIHRAPRVSGLRCPGDGSVPPPLQNFANFFFFFFFPRCRRVENSGKCQRMPRPAARRRPSSSLSLRDEEASSSARPPPKVSQLVPCHTGTDECGPRLEFNSRVSLVIKQWSLEYWKVPLPDTGIRAWDTDACGVLQGSDCFGETGHQRV